MKKKIALSLLTILSVGMLAGAAEAHPSDKYRANQWRDHRIAQAQRYRYGQNNFWNRQRFIPPGHRRDFHQNANKNHRHWW